MIKGRIDFMTAEKFAGDIELLFMIDPNACVDVPVTFIHRAGSKIKPATAYQMFKETRAFVKRKKYINKFISNGSVVSASGTNAHDENGGNL
jgi:hypothetical protein